MATPEPRSAPKHSVPGTAFGIEKALHIGDTGALYVVERDRNRYLLRTAHPELNANTSPAVQLAREARALGRIHHPNLAGAVGTGLTAERPRGIYVLLEDLAGHSLRSVLLRKKKLPVETACTIAIDVLDALSAVHEAGLAMGAISPETIFLHKETARRSITKLIPTTSLAPPDARYASPERAQGAPASTVADVYAVAVTLYEMIAGRGPFDDLPTKAAILKAHVTSGAPPLSKFASAIPVALEDLLTLALSKRAARRPKDASTFAAKLRALLHATAS